MGQGEVSWYIHPKGVNSMAVCGFGCKNPSVVSFTNGLEKQSSHPQGSMQCSSVIYQLELASIA